jgi:hypothetical protein
MIFDRCFLFFKGAVAAMSDGGTLEGQGDPIPADTLVESLAGVTPAPQHYMITSDNFVPQTGFEFDAFKEWAEVNEVPIKIQFGGSGKAMTGSAFVMAPSLKWGAADHTKLSIKLLAKVTQFK